MRLLERLRAEWLAPFPFYRGAKEEIGLPLLNILLFTTLLVFVRPFGLAGQGILTVLGYGAVALLVVLTTVAFWYALRNRINDQAWHTGKQTLRALFDLLCLVCGLLFYHLFIHDISIEFDLFIQFLIITLLFGFILLSLRVLRTKNRLLKKRLAESEELNQVIRAPSRVSEATDELTFQSDLVKEGFTIPASQLLFAQAESNYVTFYMVDAQAPNRSSLDKRVLRLSLTKAVGQSNSALTRCHRSFAVRVGAVHQVTGNAQGLKLHFRGMDSSVPVSRKYIPEIRALLSRNEKPL